MPRPPAETRYAVSDGVHIAYQVVGEGDVDLMFLPAKAAYGRISCATSP